MQAQTIVPEAYNCDTKQTVKDYAVFLDRYNMTHDHCGVPIKITGHEYQFHTLLNDHQVMYEISEDKYNTDVLNHNTNLHKCADLVYHGITVFAIVELGENYGRVLQIIPEKDITQIITPEQYNTLIGFRDTFACYEERRQEVLDMEADMEYLRTEDACVYTIKMDVLRYEDYQEIKQYLQKFHKRLDVVYGYPMHSAAKDKLRDLERKRTALITPGVEAPHLYSLRKL